MSSKIRPLNEDAIQQGFVSWLRLNKPDIWFTHIANEGKRSAAYSRKLWAMGLTKGAPDMLLLINGKVAFIEFKTKKGKLSKEQKLFRDICKEPYLLARSAKEAIEQVEAWCFEQGFNPTQS